MYPIQRNYSYQRRPGRLPIQQPRRHKRLKLAAGILVIAAVGVLMHGIIASGEPKGPNQKTAGVSTQKAASQPEPPKKTVNTDALQPALSQTIKKYPYDTSVSVVELNSGKLIQTGDSYPFVAASTTKLLTALLYLSNVEAGKAKLDEELAGKPARTQLQLMVNKSDNTAWQTLNDNLGHDSLTAYASKLGIQTYNADKNTINSNDMAQLLAKLYKGELINRSNTDLLLSWMQNTSEEQFIPPAVPNNIKLFHKAGYLEDRAHDVAIIDNGSTPFILVIYSKSYGKTAYNFTTGQKLFKEVVDQSLATFTK